jgi:hypothetical protein
VEEQQAAVQGAETYTAYAPEEAGPSVPDAALLGNLCPVYITTDGCPKGDACEWEHPVSPNGSVTKRVCDYYMSERGCAKQERCDFLHHYGKPKSKPEAPPKPLCAYYLSERGCVKDDRCEFWHPKAPNGTASKRICEYFQSVRGCAKDDRCDFLHIVDEHKQFPRGGAAASRPLMTAPTMYGGAQMYTGDAYGSSAGGEGTRPPKRTKAQDVGNTRVCDFYQSARGCAKDERCDFIHSHGTGAPASGRPQPAMGGAQNAHATLAQAAAQYQAAAAAYAAATQSLHSQAGTGYDTQAASQDPYSAYPGFSAAPAPSPYAQPGYEMYAAYGGYDASGMAAAVAPVGTKHGVCSFYASGKGCRKGEHCDFTHPSATPIATSRPSARYNPY